MQYVKIHKNKIEHAEKLLSKDFESYYAKNMFHFEENILVIDSDDINVLEEISYALEENNINIFHREHDCVDCMGTGEIEIDNRYSCGRATSDCCGACFDSVQCDGCDGTGRSEY